MAEDHPTTPVTSPSDFEIPQRGTRPAGREYVAKPKRMRLSSREISQSQLPKADAQEPCQQSNTRNPVIRQPRTRSTDSLDTLSQSSSLHGSVTESPSRWSAITRFGQELQSYYRLPSTPGIGSTRSGQTSHTPASSQSNWKKAFSSLSAHKSDQHASETFPTDTDVNVESKPGNRPVNKRLLRVLLEDLGNNGRSKRLRKLTNTDSPRPSGRSNTWPLAMRLPSALNPIWLDPKMRETLQDRLEILHAVQRRPTVSVGSSTSDAAMALKQGMRPVYSHSDAQAQLKSLAQATPDDSARTGNLKQSSSSEPWPDFYDSVSTPVSAEVIAVDPGPPYHVEEDTRAVAGHERAKSLSTGPNDNSCRATRGRTLQRLGRSSGTNVPRLDTVLIKNDYHEEFRISEWGASMRNLMAEFDSVEDEETLVAAPAIGMAEEGQVAAEDLIGSVERPSKAKTRRVEGSCGTRMSRQDWVNPSHHTAPEAHCSLTGQSMTGEQVLQDLPAPKSLQANAITPALDTSGLSVDDGRRVSDSVSPKSCAKPLSSTSSNQHQAAQGPPESWPVVVPPGPGYEGSVQHYGQKARDSASSNKAVSKAVAQEHCEEVVWPETCVSSKTGPLSFKIANGRRPSSYEPI